jgi:hypothetical protein
MGGRLRATINYPEAGILGVGGIINRPWVVNGELAIRKVAELTLTFDHRCATVQHPAVSCATSPTPPRTPELSLLTCDEAGLWVCQGDGLFRE